MAYDYIARHYGLHFHVGDRVKHTVTRHVGTVSREDKSQGHYVMVKFDSYRFAMPCHPEELAKEGST